MSEQVVIKATENGPNLIIVDGEFVNAPCWCGGSGMKPFCDDNHKKNGFTAQAHEVKAPTRRQTRNLGNSSNIAKHRAGD